MKDIIHPVAFTLGLVSAVAVVFLLGSCGSSPTCKPPTFHIALADREAASDLYLDVYKETLAETRGACGQQQMAREAAERAVEEIYGNK